MLDKSEGTFTGGSVWIAKRELPELKPGQKPRPVGDTGVRWDVRYRLGGRNYKLKYGGTFRSRKDAQLRVNSLRQMLANGEDPEIVEAHRERERAARRRVRDAWPAWQETLRDVGEKRLGSIGNAWAKVDPVLGDLHVDEVTAEDGIRLVNYMEREGLKPSSIDLYFSIARQFMDDQVDVNPLRSKLVRLPRAVTEDVTAMSFEEFMALREAMVADRKGLPGHQLRSGPALLLAVDWIEAGGFRLGDAQQLLWGDIDFYEGRVRVSKARGKSSRSRWVPMPRPLLDRVAERGLSAKDRVFPELTRHDLSGAMLRACKRAGLPHYHPHDLRHRRASVWIAQGVPLPDVGARLGHVDLNTTLRVYAHVVASPKDLWTEADYVGGRR